VPPTKESRGSNFNVRSFVVLATIVVAVVEFVVVSVEGSVTVVFTGITLTTSSNQSTV